MVRGCGLRIAWLILLASFPPLLMSGCATVSPDVTAARAGATTEPGWWYLRFRFARAADGTVNSYLDGLVADRLLAPALTPPDTEVSLWRFHRRWPDDAVGHQFSVLLYTSRPVAESLAARIGAEPLLDGLRAQGLLIDYRLEAGDPTRAGGIAGSSDPAWSPVVQRAWPAFIMGASRTWLELVHAEAASRSELELHARYRAVEQAIDGLWFREGGHAFLHHLNALFGYRPLRVLGDDSVRF